MIHGRIVHLSVRKKKTEENARSLPKKQDCGAASSTQVREDAIARQHARHSVLIQIIFRFVKVLANLRGVTLAGLGGVIQSSLAELIAVIMKMNVGIWAGLEILPHRKRAHGHLIADGKEMPASVEFIGDLPVTRVKEPRNMPNSAGKIPRNAERDREEDLAVKKSARILKIIAGKIPRNALLADRAPVQIHQVGKARRLPADQVAELVSAG